MPRKAIDSRIPTLIRNGIQENKRSFFVIVGDRAKDVIVHLHYIMSSVDIKHNKSVLWAYKKDLIGFTSHRKKREIKIKKEIKRGIRDANTEDPFELFVSLHNIRYVYYKETEKILGNTYGMGILQDFEAITPNLLARTMETVEGGGLVILILKGMQSLKQLYTLTMDVHSRYRTEAHGDVVARFNERFILSLGSCASCLVIDDELNVLPISGGKDVVALAPADPDSNNGAESQKAMKSLKEEHADSQPLADLLPVAKTVDQAQAVVKFVQVIEEKTLRSTVTLTAARGRGKSAALGLAVAAAIAHGYSNIFITSPSPENLKTLFEFIFKGFDKLNYLDHVDYTVKRSINPDFNKAIVRVHVHRQNRQIIQYIQPQDAHVLGQAELLIIDEAAAIPLPLVRRLMGPYLIFMASTINGYEGTGRSLSLKLIQQLRDQSYGSSKSKDSGSKAAPQQQNGTNSKNEDEGDMRGRTLKEVSLNEPIRYGVGDNVEKWLNKLLCLDATLPRNSLGAQGSPHPSQCQLFQVNRDTLFSFHPISEKFLQQMMALYVASHYKNSPNDLQLMSDAPAHSLFVLVPPLDPNNSRLPRPLCVVQVALEGQISNKSVITSLGRGQRASGDLIPWLVSQQYQDGEFAGLSGARIVRVATDPDYTNMGFGSQALSLLCDFYEGKFVSLEESDSVARSPQEFSRVDDESLSKTSLLNNDIKIREINEMPPLFSRLSEMRPPPLDYIGVSYGLTSPLLKFWKRLSFAPVYLRQTANELTGEHTCVMLRTVSTPTSVDPDWLPQYVTDFQRRLLSLLSFNFRTFPSALALSLNDACVKLLSASPAPSKPLTKSTLDTIFIPRDLKRLETYAENMLDYHVILDLLPRIATLYFTNQLSPLQLPALQASILLSVGPQRKDLAEAAAEFDVPTSQLLALFVKLIRKVSRHIRSIREGELENVDDTSAETHTNGTEKQNPFLHSSLPYNPLPDLSTELAEASAEVEVDDALREKQRALIDALPLERFEIDNAGDEKKWDEAGEKVKGGSSVVAVKSEKVKKRKKGESAREIYEAEFGEKDGKKGKGKERGNKKSKRSKD